ncbi:MAG: plasmid pRiA4b family protein [Akkermansiaceae bacterium]|nr:plasmid pRiA4b family protein [Akkermansiaceae bacterium]
MSEPRFVIKVFLYQITPQIWRRFSVPASFNFLQLNDAIQDAMGWENKHPHEFRHGKGKRLVDVIGPVGLADQTPGEFQDELKITIAEFLGKKKLPVRILYRYDFAEEWIHEIVFEKRAEGEGGAEMIDGARACPPEDFGGVFQYMEALHGQIGWYRGEYDPEAFDIKEVVFGGKKRNPKKRKLR